MARTTSARHRLHAAKARTDMRAAAVARRARTRHLIELGGLVIKAGLVELTHDDRAALFGGFLDCAARLASEDRDQILTLWRRRGQRAFAAGSSMRQKEPDAG